MNNLDAIRAAALKFLADEPAALEVEYHFTPVPALTMSVWVGRDGAIYDRPRFAS